MQIDKSNVKYNLNVYVKYMNLIKDLLELEGAFKHKAIRNKSRDEIRRLEKKAWEDAAVERHLKSLRKMKG